MCEDYCKSGLEHRDDGESSPSCDHRTGRSAAGSALLSLPPVEEKILQHSLHLVTVEEHGSRDAEGRNGLDYGLE